jgi:hypothetical protein
MGKDVDRPKATLVPDISPKLDKSKPNRSLARRERIPVDNPKVARIIRILRDDITLAAIQDLAENGASLSTIDATLKYPPNTMSTILTKGKLAKSNKNPYRIFFMEFRSWVAKARGTAELIMAKKSPEKWLDRNSSNKVLESEEDLQLAENAPSNPKLVASSGVDLATVQKALEILREQGADLNQAIDKGEFQLYIESNNKEPDDDED